MLEAIGIEPGEPPPRRRRRALPPRRSRRSTTAPRTPDEVARATGLAAGAVAAALTELELAGLVEARAGVLQEVMPPP